MGIRLEAAYKEPDFDDNGVPVLLANQEHTIRLFGEGFTRDMLITFTRDTGSYNDPCTLPAVRGFAVSKRWLLIFIMCKSFCLNLRNVGEKKRYFRFSDRKRGAFHQPHGEGEDQSASAAFRLRGLLLVHQTGQHLLHDVHPSGR